MAKIDELLRRMPESGASDTFFAAGRKPKVKLFGEAIDIEVYYVLENGELRSMLFEILSEEQEEYFNQHSDLDFGYAIEGVGRFRCNYFVQRTGYGACFRLIPSRLVTLDELSMPPIVKKLCGLRSGLILATGPTGSGKTTTLAAMLHYINEHSRRRIVTIEEPVEFVHQSIKSLVSHREVGVHSKSFVNALRGVTRQDADVVMVGELKDQETMGLAMSAAAMGILVFGTLPTNSAAKTIDRIIDMFPAEEQPQIRTVLAESLAGIVCQQLIKLNETEGRIAAVEVLLGNTALANIIREGRIERVSSVFQTGRRDGMQLMDDSLFDLVKKELIDGVGAYMKADDKSRFQQFIKGKENSAVDD
ncbi:MAG: PilT/PilU family type 4a pilus ATPase [Planctomycetales bacterium]